jgi:hypothetical protein
LRFNQAKLRSTTHLRGWMLKPRVPGARSTTSSSHTPAKNYVTLVEVLEMLCLY